VVKLHWIPLIPLLGAIINGLWAIIAARFQKQPSRNIVVAIANGAAFLSFFVSILFFFQLLKFPGEERAIVESIYSWIQVGDFHVSVAFRLDPLSALMVLVVTGVGSFIHLYSIGYMAKDPSFARYFAYLNLFLASMLILVLANNLVLMFVGWEGVGLCSYLLIGFWFSDEAKASAGKKAFIVNRVGDLGFLLGLFLCFTTLGSVEFQGMAEACKAFLPGSAEIPHALAWIGFLLFLGACGKSAQFPLHIWLPDAMAGPTPVSALIHAATMVTAGVYMIARLSFLYALVPEVGFVIAVVGCFTALFAAFIALTQNDIKKVLAYSTISQLGYMFLAVGSGAYVAGIFHLMTHAFFKGLLFLGAGSVIHAMSEEQDIRKMGGLFRLIPITSWTFLLATLAIIGLPPFSGFFSKDEILWRVLESGHGWLYVLGLFAAFLTAIYMSRLFILTFWGQFRGEQKVWDHVHESPKTMTIPLMVLAFFSVIAGFFGLPHFLHFLGPNALEGFLEPVFAQAHQVTIAFHQAKEGALSVEHPPYGEFLGSFIAVLIAASGVGFAYLLFIKRPSLAKSFSSIKPLYETINNKFYIDEIYQKMIIRPVYWFSLEGLWKKVDIVFIDGVVNGVAHGIGYVSLKLRKIQTGQVRYYALSIALGSALLIGYVLLISGTNK